MAWYYWLSVVSLAFCLLFYFYYIIKLIKTSKASDFAKPSGSKKNSVKYSLSKAMSPSKKESAYLHLPTYTAGCSIILVHSYQLLCIY